MSDDAKPSTIEEALDTERAHTKTLSEALEKAEAERDEWREGCNAQMRATIAIEMERDEARDEAARLREALETCSRALATWSKERLWTKQDNDALEQARAALAGTDKEGR